MLYIPLIEFKSCPHCKKEFAATRANFYKGNGKGRLTSKCRTCHYAYKRKWTTENHEQVLRQQREYRETHREAIHGYNRRYYERHPELKGKWSRENPERRKQIGRTFRRRHPERLRRWRQEYTARNLHKVKIQRARRLAIRRNPRGEFSVEDIYRKYDEQQGRCYYCGKPLPANYHIDHHIPIVSGGSNQPENIVLACPACNYSKGRKLPDEWQGPR